MKTPISLIIDDAAPLVHIYRSHVTPPLTRDGREILPYVPNSLLTEFCDTVEKYGIKGKFSVVPCPAGKGFINDKIEGFPESELNQWLDITKKRLSPYFDFCPEIITHFKTADLKNGGFLNMTELEWGRTASREELAEYISTALKICLDVGIECTGVTSPWNFGEGNEANYASAIADAFYATLNKRLSWYFLHGIINKENIRPWVEYDFDGKKVVSVPKTVSDYFWGTIDIDDNSESLARLTADYFITEDGRRGAIIDALNKNCFPIICTHWQSMFSNGNFTGVKALAIVAERINTFLSDTLEWTDFSSQAALAAADNIPRPEF